MSGGHMEKPPKIQSQLTHLAISYLIHNIILDTVPEHTYSVYHSFVASTILDRNTLYSMQSYETTQLYHNIYWKHFCHNTQTGSHMGCCRVL